MVWPREAGSREPPRLPPRRPGGHDLGLQLRGHRLGHGGRAAAALRRDPVRRRGVPRDPAGAAGREAPWRVLVGVGAFMSLGQFGFLYVSMAAGMPPGLAALVLQAQVIFTIVIAAGVLRELPDASPGRGRRARHGRARRGRPSAGAGTSPLLALALCLLAALSWGIGNVVSRAAGVTGGLSLDGVVGASWCRCRCSRCRCSSTARRPSPTRSLSFSWQAVLSTLYTAGLASLVGYGDLQLPAGAQPVVVVVPWVLLAPVVAMASAWCCSTRLPTRPRPRVVSCSSSACWSRCCRGGAGGGRRPAQLRPTTGCRAENLSSGAIARK